MPTYEEVWKKLAPIDVSEYVKKKMNLSFLSWTWAWKVMMENYPQARYSFSEPKFMPDKSCMVECTVTIDELSRSMWLPVMDHKNNAIPNPSSRQISDGQMRCLVKCIAMFGLGHYIYAGEDLPEEATTKEPAAKPPSAPAKTKKEEPVDNKEDLPKDTGVGQASPAARMHLFNATEEALKIFLEGATSIDQVRRFWQDNKDVLNRMQTEDSRRYNRVLDAFKKKQVKLAGR